MSTPSSDRALSWRAAFIPAAAIAFAVSGAALLLLRRASWGHVVWLAGLLIAGAPVMWRTVRNVTHGHFATDIVAALAIGSALALDQPLAGLVIVLMQTGGEALEQFAEGRASRAVQQLEEDAPRIANRFDDGTVTGIPVDDIRVGDQLLVRPSEMVPCDCSVVAGQSRVDASRLTGEPLPLAAAAGTRLLSGMLNLEGAITVRATALASESQYARIVELVRSAAASKSPLQRLADRYAVWFTPITIAACLAAWIISGDPTRALAVLVVATPCPLILATPIAIIGGINRAASRQIIIRTGQALEQLDQVRVAAFDKTGTLTIGKPAVSRVVAVPPLDTTTLLGLAGAVEQHSGYTLARSVVDAAIAADARLSTPVQVMEDAGRGISATVGNQEVAIGSRDYAIEHMSRASASVPVAASELTAYVTVDGAFAGTIVFADRLRPHVREVLTELHRLGVRRTALLSGDHEDNVRAVGREVGIDEVYWDLLPAEKLDLISAMSTSIGKVLMVGDGTNDAPALSRADVGVALAGHGGGVTAEAADVVILVDDLSRVAVALGIGRRTMRIARQSIWVGLGLSGLAMAIAFAGFIPPVAGALLQEAIDVAVIVNALRASFAERTTAAAGRVRRARRGFPRERTATSPTASRPRLPDVVG